MSIEPILRDADLALAESLQSDEKARLDALRQHAERRDVSDLVRHVLS